MKPGVVGDHLWAVGAFYLHTEEHEGGSRAHSLCPACSLELCMDGEGGGGQGS